MSESTRVVSKAQMRVNVEASVKRGAALLDARDPNWAKDLGPMYSAEYEKAVRAGDPSVETDDALKAITDNRIKFIDIVGNEQFNRPQAHEGDLVRYKRRENVTMLDIVFGMGNPLDLIEGEFIDPGYYGFYPETETALFGIPTNTATPEQWVEAAEAAENGQKYCPVRHGFELEEFWSNEIAARQGGAKEVAA